jgi:ring-1,2-phenylacetyl-CoA epoxidase subunit PaaD
VIEERASDLRISLAWQALAAVEDPEIPAVSILDLGLIRGIGVRADGVLDVALSPTYVGCPATQVIQQAAQNALERAALGPCAVNAVLSPPWTSDWITAEGRRKLQAYGIVPPQHSTGSLREALRGQRAIPCPRCGSIETECLSEFGSTPCKALHRCRACLEPFEYFKCI